jgi:hypothetical protein
MKNYLKNSMNLKKCATAGTDPRNDDQGSHVRDSVVEVQDGTFGKKALTLETILPL